MQVAPNTWQQDRRFVWNMPPSHGTGLPLATSHEAAAADLDRRLRMWKHPGVWTFATCWLAAAAWLLCQDHEAIVYQYGASLLPLAAFVALTIRLTEPPPPAVLFEERRAKLWIQVVLVLCVAVVTGWSALATHGAIESGPMIPGWSQIVHAGGRLAQRLGVPYNWGANPLRYCFLPALFLLPLTGWKYLGLRKGHRSGRVIALWCMIPALIAAYQARSGSRSAVDYAWGFANNTFQNGPFEEFLFRGALQTRLQMLIGPIWGIVLASLLFGVWHLGLGFTTTGKDSIADGLASTIVVQGTMGLCLGVIFFRTRNLLACSVVHVMLNTVFG